MLFGWSHVCPPWLLLANGYQLLNMFLLYVIHIESGHVFVVKSDCKM